MDQVYVFTDHPTGKPVLAVEADSPSDAHMQLIAHGPKELATKAAYSGLNIELVQFIKKEQKQ